MNEKDRKRFLEQQTAVVLSGILASGDLRFQDHPVRRALNRVLQIETQVREQVSKENLARLQRSRSEEMDEQSRTNL